MDRVWGTLLAVVVGVLASPLAEFVRDWVRERRSRKLDSIWKERLRRILMLPNRRWRELSYLARAVGASEQRTQRLLLEIDARQSLSRDSTKWALVSRAPFPDDVESEQDSDDSN
jgi:hypothetical protein